MPSNLPPRPGLLPDGAASDRLASWKAIAAHLDRTERTVQRWEHTEALPIHRHLHDKRSSVYAFKHELDAWWERRGAALHGDSASPGGRTRKLRIALFMCLALLTVAATFGLLSRCGPL